jgi:hypothetical protein
MFILDTTPDTSPYMIAGFTIFFVLLIIYLISLFIRTRNLNQDLAILESMKKNFQVTAGRPEAVKPAANTHLAVKRKTTRKNVSKSNKVKKKVIKKK